MPIQSYKDLTVWQKSMDLLVEIYRLTKLFPRDEQFALTSQVRRAAISIPSNIAEGHGRLTKAEFRHFLCIARGSFAEAETQLQIAIRLSYLTEDQMKQVYNLFGDVGRLLNGLIRALEHDGKQSPNNGRISEETELYDPRLPLIPNP